MIDKKIIEELKGMSREEKAAYFEKNSKTLLNANDLDAVNGGADDINVLNPNSEETAPEFGPWFSSFGYICDGEEIC